jgi:hypothetical protein
MKIAQRQVAKPFQTVVLLKKAFSALAKYTSRRSLYKNFDRKRVIRHCFQQMLDGSIEQRVMAKIQTRVRLRHLSQIMTSWVDCCQRIKKLTCHLNDKKKTLKSLVFSSWGAHITQKADKVAAYSQKSQSKTKRLLLIQWSTVSARLKQKRELNESILIYASNNSKKKCFLRLRLHSQLSVHKKH